MYGFAHKSTLRRFGHYVVVNDRKGNPLLYPTKEAAQEAMKEHQRKYRDRSDNYIVVEVTNG